MLATSWRSVRLVFSRMRTGSGGGTGSRDRSLTGSILRTRFGGRLFLAGLTPRCNVRLDLLHVLDQIWPASVLAHRSALRLRPLEKQHPDTALTQRRHPHQFPALRPGSLECRRERTGIRADIAVIDAGD